MRSKTNCNSKMNYERIMTIVNSRDFRNLEDKTQLFYATSENRVRTRLTHSVEVKTIAYEIGKKINAKMRRKYLDLELIDAIALAHDIGHTPFGHIGERTINDILSRKDDLGGLLTKRSINPIGFKHNVNSFRILDELEIDDWRILDGVLCHTKVFRKNDLIRDLNIYNPLVFGQSKSSKIKKYDFFKEKHNNFTANDVSALTLEGQVVAIADEIAQRAADISDGLEKRYYEKIKKIVGSSFKTSICSKENLGVEIRKLFVDDVVSNSFKNIQENEFEYVKENGLSHKIYKVNVVDFSDAKRKNQQ